jgi:hypothetical protein
MSRIEWRIDAGSHVVLRNPPFLGRKVELNGQRIDGKWKSKRFAFNLADGRPAQLELKADAFSRTTQLSVNGKVIPDTRCVPQELRCPACNAEIQLLDEYCSGCGHALGSPDRFLSHRSVQSATTAIRVLAVLYALFGVFMFFVLKDNANAALANLAQYQDNETLAPIDGVTYTAGELRAQVLWEHRGVLVVNLILSALMLVLAWWSKRKPLAAILIATAIFAVVQVLGAIEDPKSITQGILIKIVVIGVLVRGIKGAFSLRTANG